MSKRKPTPKTWSSALKEMSPSELRALARNLPKKRYGETSVEAGALLLHAAQVQDRELFVAVAKDHLVASSYSGLYSSDPSLFQRLSAITPKWLLWLVDGTKEEEKILSYILSARQCGNLDWSSVVRSGRLSPYHLSVIFYSSLAQGKALCPLDLVLDMSKGVIEAIENYHLPPTSAQSFTFGWAGSSYAGDEKGYKMANHLSTEKIKSCDLLPLLRVGMYMTAYSIFQHLKLNDQQPLSGNKITPSSWANTSGSINRSAKILGRNDLVEFKDFLMKFLNIRKTDRQKQTSLHMVTSLTAWPEDVAVSFLEAILNNKPILPYQQDSNGKRIIDNVSNPLAAHVVSFVEKRGICNALKHQVKKRKKTAQTTQTVAPTVARTTKRRM